MVRGKSTLFTKALVRTPGRSLIHGLTSGKHGIPDFHRALVQHAEYINALRECGLEVLVLKEDEDHPDSTFIEDVALLTPPLAIVTNPGAPSRRGETEGMKEILAAYFESIEEICEPGTVEAGDIMMVGTHFYIGVSERTNKAGAAQVIGYLNKHGLSGSILTLEKVLHLKTGTAYLEHNNLVASGEFIEKPEFRQFNILRIERDEEYAANCIWINEKVLLPKGYPKSRKTVEAAGYEVIDVDVSEFRALDGGLSCLSLRF